jgi:hypothetical protein
MKEVVMTGREARRDKDEDITINQGKWLWQKLFRVMKGRPYK